MAPRHHNVIAPIGLVALACVLAGTSAAQAFIPLSPVRSSRSQAISPDGQCVYGWYETSDPTDSGLWRWDARDGGYTALSQFAGLNTTQDIRPTPDGLSYFGNPNLSRPHAMIWSPSSGFTYLPEPSGTATSYVNAASQTGSTLAGAFARVGAVGYESYRWSRETGFQALPGNPLPSRGTSATAISRDGSIIAGFTGNSAAWWDESNTLHLVTVLPGSTEGFARSVSVDGRFIAGVFSYPVTDPVSGASPPFLQGFVVDRVSGVTQFLGQPAGSSNSDVQLMSGDGQTILALTDGPSQYALWTRTQGWRYLDDVLASLGIGLNGYQIDFITGISDDGRYLLGNCSLAGSQFGDPGYAFRLEIPTPATGTALLAALSAMVARRRR